MVVNESEAIAEVIQKQTITKFIWYSRV